MTASQLDHLVLASADLEAGMRHLEDRTGLRPRPGGAHPGLGTRNAVLGLTLRGQQRCYLELLAPDPDQPQVPREAMMLDLGSRLDQGLGDEPRVHTWVVEPHDLDLTMARARAEGVEVGEIVAASRVRPDGVRLAWRLAVPRPLAHAGLQPGLIDWGSGAHPSDVGLPTVELVRLRLEHPEPNVLANALETLGVDLEVRPAPGPRLVVTLETPRGTIELS